jgi:hypothetical protein
MKSASTEKTIRGDLNTGFEFGGTDVIPDDLIPNDWDNRGEIPDPDDHKPDNWDDWAVISDPDVHEPPEGGEDVHGKWSSPLIQGRGGAQEASREKEPVTDRGGLLRVA